MEEPDLSEGGIFAVYFSLSTLTNAAYWETTGEANLKSTPPSKAASVPMYIVIFDLYYRPFSSRF